MTARRLISLCCVFFLSISLAWAQGTTSRISGVATDASGAVVPNAIISVTNDDTGVTYTTKGSDAGTYSFNSLQIGRYTVRAEAPGFRTFISTGNVLAIGIPTSIDPKLQIGAASESVQVEGGYDLVQTESSGNFGAIIDNVTLTQLPIVGTRGRNPLALTQYIPGVIQNNSGNAPGGDIVVNGSRDRAFNYILDGIDDNETSSGGSNTSPSHQNPDMLAEFRVITANPTTEFGRNSGAQVLMVTRSGTNRFHGNLFEFYQSPFLQANTSAAKAAVPQQRRPQFVQNIYGGSLGGPIWKDKAFFFANLELLHALSSIPVVRTVYTATARAGQIRYISSPGGTVRNSASVDASGNPVIPVNSTLGTYNVVANDPFHVGLDTAQQAFLGRAPLPNNFTVGDGLNTAGYNFSAPANDRQVDTTYKIDYIFNQKNSIFGRISTGHQNTFNDVVNGGLQTFPGLPGVVNTLRQPRNMAINYRFSPTKSITNELVVGFNRFGYSFINPGFAAAVTQPFNSNLVTNPLVSAIGNNRYLTTLQYVDNVTFVKGAHIYKAGFNLRNGREIDHRGSIGSLNAIPQVNFSIGNNPLNTTQYNTPGSGCGASGSCINTTDQTGLYNATNDLLGRIGAVTAGYVAQSDLSAFKPAGTINTMDARWDEYDFYIQDTWHALPNLVIDYGLRDDTRLAPKFQGFPSLVPNQDITYGKQLTSPLQFVPGKFMNNRWNNFGPSVGFAWDPFRDGKSSVRGNYRIAYDRINSFSFSSSVFQGLPGRTYQVTNGTSGQDSFCSAGSPAGCANVQGLRAKNWAPPVPTATPSALTTPPAYSSNSLTVSDPNMQTPTVQMWGLSIQRQIMKNTALTVSYIGNHATHLYGGYDSNQSEIRSNGFLAAFRAAQAGQNTPLLTQLISSDSRHTAGQTGVQFLQKNYAAFISPTSNNVAGLANALAQRLQSATPANPNGVPLVVSSGLPANFFKPYSQYLGGFIVLRSSDYSNYNGLQVQVERRMLNGFLVTMNYTYSKALDVRSFDPTFTILNSGSSSSQSAAGTPFDYHTPSLNYAASDLDNTHVLNGYFVLDLPFGRNRAVGAHWNRAVDTILGGWQIAGDGYLQSGRPITLFSGYNTYSGSVQTPAACAGNCNSHMGNIHVESTGNGNQTYYFTAAQRAQFFTPAAGTFSNIGRNFFRQNHVWQADATLSKSFRVYKEQNLQLRLEAQNVFNVITYDTFGSSLYQSNNFTRLNPASDGVLNNSPRKMQLSAKYVF